ncbi:MAG: Ig-like domain-containing protein, partial [Deltaproteobacteria bacterium]|nr:Ig-like domain-containing protein [Nannocystaceae bacterium]
VEAPRRAPAGEPLAASQGRIFVNFDGATLTDGWDDSTSNVTQIGECAGNFAAYGEGAKRDAVMQAVRDDWSAYNVILVDDRPDSGDYTMNMTGPSNPFGGGVLGIAPLDCDDSQTHNNITYAFHSINDNFDASTTATTIGQEVAHSYGLEHVDEPGDIMNPFNAGGDPSFTDVCLGIVADGGIVCGSQHAAECGSSSQQNSHQELLTLFGPSMPDGASPSVSITSPSDGTSFDEGATFEITVDADDDVGIDQVALFNNGEQIQTDGSSPYGWTVENAPAGSYEFYVEATDPSGNVSMSNTVTISVGVGAPTDDSGDEGGEGIPPDDGDGGSNDAGDDGAPADEGDDGGNDTAFGDTGDGSLPPGFGLDREAQSCACSSETAPRAGWLFMIALVGAARRRRRPSARETS